MKKLRKQKRVKASAKEWTATLETIGWNNLVISNGEAHQVQTSDQSLTKLEGVKHADGQVEKTIDINLDTLCTIAVKMKWEDLVR